MTEQRRWDTDKRLTGIADAAQLATDIDRLLRAAEHPGWVAEDADAHLGEQLRQACTDAGSPWRWLRAAQAADGV